MDTRLLTLFFVLTIAVELGKASDLFDRLVAAVARRAGSARGLAWGMVGASGVLAAVLTNDVALFLVVPFTMAFRRVSDLDLTPIVVLEVASANLIGAVSPLGNPQNLFLYTRGHFTPAAFFANQIPWGIAATLLLAAAVPLLVPKRALASPAAEVFDVHPVFAGGCLILLGAEIAALFHLLDHRIPLVLAVGGAALLGRRLRETDFSLVLVFAFLFVGIAGLERGRLYHALDFTRLFGHEARGLVLSGAVLSQLVSNVPRRCSSPRPRSRPPASERSCTGSTPEGAARRSPRSRTSSARSSLLARAAIREPSGVASCRSTPSFWFSSSRCRSFSSRFEVAFPAMSEFLRLEALEKRFGALAAARNVSLTAAAGEIVALLGPSRQRQDDGAPADGRVRDAGLGPHPRRGRGRHRGCLPSAGASEWSSSTTPSSPT